MGKINKKRTESDKRAIKVNIVVSILLVVVLSFISTGYALYAKRLDINGTATFHPQGKIIIANVTLTSSKNVRDGSIPTYTDDSVDFNLTFEKAAGSTEEDYQAVYSITIDNNTFYNHEFNLGTFQPIITNSSGIEVDPSFLTYSLSGISIGDMIPAGEEVTFTLTLDFTPDVDDTYSVDGDLEPELIEEPNGSVLGSVSPSQGDLRESLGKDIAQFTISLINSYQSPRDVTLHISDTSHFRLTDASGNDLQSITINGGTTEDYIFYVKRVANAIFTTDSLTTTISLSHTDATNVNCGSITLLVDATALKDETPPNISGVTASYADASSNTTTDNNVGQVTVSWSGSDAESGVKKYYVAAYSVSGSNKTYVNTFETVSDETSLTVTGLADGTYVFRVYGENNDGYKPSTSDINSPSSSSGIVVESASGTYDWHYTVSYTSDSQYMKTLSPTAVNRGWNYTTTLQKNDDDNRYTYTLPTSITVQVNGTTISTGTTSGKYQYNSSTGALTIYGVTGNVTIKAVATRANKSVC